MAKLTGHVYSHTHWDRAWYWTFEETRTRLLDLMDDLLALLRREPRYRHFVLDGQLAMVEDYLALRPERRAEIKHLAAAGRLLLGPFYVLPDLFIPAGESLIRNLERGQRLAAALGPVMAIGYLPDPFGHPAQLPQVLAGFGIEGVLLARGVGDEGERLGADFLWEAPDGTAVLATHQVGGGYCNFARLGGEAGSFAERVARAVELTCRRAEEMAPACPHQQLLLANGCDHLPPQADLPLLLEAINRRCRAIILRHSTPSAYQAAVRASIRAGCFRPGVHRGELRGSRYANLLSGVLSARTDLKLLHHAVEVELLRWSEPWLAVARGLGRGRDDVALLERAWKLLLLCQPHDDICGCSIDAVHDDDRNRLARAGQLARRITERALEALLPATVDSTGDEAVAVHSHPWPWRRVVLLPGWRTGVRSALGELPSQPVEGGVLVEVELPALGWLPLLPSRATPPAPRRPARARLAERAAQLDNELISVRIGRDGKLSLEHRATGLRYQLKLVDEGDAGDTYDFSTPTRQRLIRAAGTRSVRLLETGPLRVTAEAELELHLPVSLGPDRRSRSTRLRRLPVRLRIQIEAGSPLCEIDLWLQNTVDEHRLRAALTCPFAVKDVLAGAPFQVLSRPLALPAGRDWQQPPSPTVPLQGFAAAEQRGRGLAVLTPGLRELEARTCNGGRGTELLVTLLRSVQGLSRGDLRTRSGHAGPDLPVDGARQLAPLQISLGLLPYSGGWVKAGVPRFTEEHAAPPRVVALRLQGAPPQPCSFLSIEGPASVGLSALRPGEHGPQLRLVNLEVRKQRVALTSAYFGQPRHVRLDRRLLPGKVQLDKLELGPARLLTLELKRILK